MDKRVPFFFSAFCSMMVGSTVLHTSAGVMLAGVGASAAERIQAVFTAANASGFSAPEIAPLELKAEKVGFIQAKASIPSKDKTIVAIADALASRGENAMLDRIWARNLHIPITTPGNGPLSVKRIQMKDNVDGIPLDRTAMLIVTDKRYLILNVDAGEFMTGTANDESGTIIGGWLYKPQQEELPADAANGVFAKSREFWAAKLASTQTASTGS